MLWNGKQKVLGILKPIQWSTDYARNLRIETLIWRLCGVDSPAILPLHIRCFGDIVNSLNSGAASRFWQSRIGVQVLEE